MMTTELSEALLLLGMITIACGILVPILLLILTNKSETLS